MAGEVGLALAPGGSRGVVSRRLPGLESPPMRGDFQLEVTRQKRQDGL